MRTLFLLRGAPGSGKSTWVKDNHLEPYTLETDAIRMLMQCPVLKTDGQRTITQRLNKDVFELMHNMLERRMARGEFVCVDATHYKLPFLSAYKKLIDKYKYRAYVVDFSDVPMETALQRNTGRIDYKRVPESAIKKMYTSFNTEMKKVPARMEVLTPDSASQMIKSNEGLLYDFNKYDKVVIFGDIHGCYEPLKRYLEQEPINDNNYYIFVGDYLDRGIQNKEVLEFLLSLNEEGKERRNVLLLEGNHEKWLCKWANDEEIYSREFLNYTQKEIEEVPKSNPKYNILHDVPGRAEKLFKKDVRQLCRRFAQMAYFTYSGKNYFVTHGGVPVLPSLLIATQEYIDGVGYYENTDKVYDTWMKKTDENDVLVHGHRNIYSVPTKFNDRIYNLCSKVENGEPLRVLEISKQGEKTLLFDNPIYAKDRPAIQVSKKIVQKETKTEILRQMNHSTLINKKFLGDGIVSYNFTRDAFDKKQWNELTEKARGLFVNFETETVVARGYDKFFNWGEHTPVEKLKDTLKFPVTAYKKENGFLGLISWDAKKDDFFICTKSTNTGDMARVLRANFDELVPAAGKEELKKYLMDGKHTLLFECVDPVSDPHIIAYKKNHLYLLDSVENEFDTKRTPYDELINIANRCGLECKEKYRVFDKFSELHEFITKVNGNTGVLYEGWVFEDTNGFMVKYKTPFYLFWKHMRNTLTAIQRNRPLRETFINDEEIKVINCMVEMNKENPKAFKELSIIDIEKKYLGDCIYCGDTESNSCSLFD